MKIITFIFFVLAFFASTSNADSCTTQLTLNGAVGPATSDAFERAISQAEVAGCGSLLFLINTPGGNLQTTRMMVEKILDSKIPILCFVWPRGGHAGSAGAILLQACHVSGAGPATNIGAATPISGDGGSIPDDLRNKLIEDTKSWVTGLARLRGRNENFAAESITKAKAIDSDEAAKIKAIDTVAKSPEEFLEFANGRVVKMDGDRTAEVKTGVIQVFDGGLRFKLLDFFTDPQFAYLIFMASLALLYFEFTNPGFGAPGVVGALGLIVSLMSFHKLDAWWGGLALIFFGVVCLIAEAFIPSFGVLGIAGLVAFSAGSILLYDPMVIGERLPYSTVFAIVGTIGVLMLLLAVIVYRSRIQMRNKAREFESGLIGAKGKVMRLETSKTGMAEIRGELWKIESDQELTIGVEIGVLHENGLVLKVQRI